MAQAEFFNDVKSQEGGNRNTEVGPTNAIRLSSRLSTSIKK